MRIAVYPSQSLIYPVKVSNAPDASCQFQRLVELNAEFLKYLARKVVLGIRLASGDCRTAFISKFD